MTRIGNILRLCGLDNSLILLSGISPCLWSVAWARYYLKYNTAIQNIALFSLFIIVFTSIRTIITSIAELNTDKYIRKTKSTVLSSGQVSLRTSIVVLLFFGLVYFYMLFLFKPIAVFFGLCAAVLAIIGPFVKHLTKRPQLLSSAIQNIGLIMAYSNVSERLTTSVVVLYVASIYWTTASYEVYFFEQTKEETMLNIHPGGKKNNKDQKEYINRLLAIMIILMMSAGLIDSLPNAWFYYVFVFIFVGLLGRIFTLVDIKNKNQRNRAFAISTSLGLIMPVVIYFSR